MKAKVDSTERASSAPADDRREFLTDAQFCREMHITEQTSLRWRRDGDGPPFIRVGRRHILYRRSDIETWLQSRTFAHRAEEAAAA